MTTGGRPFLLTPDGVLLSMSDRPYESEEELQSLLANHPELLVGDLIDPGSPRRWALISREAGLPSRDGGGARWGVDHLFIDHEGIPTIIEVKRSSDTRIRREVVGQMLDYAANGVVYWPAESLRLQYAATHEATPRPCELPEAETALFWEQVSANLVAGRVRLVFVADRIPPELQRIIEFLNEQMSPAEVLGIELPQFQSDSGMRTIAPQLIGRTQLAQRAKGRDPVDGRTFSARLEQAEEGVHELAIRLGHCAQELGLVCHEGARSRSYSDGTARIVVRLYTSGLIEFNLSGLRQAATDYQLDAVSDLLASIFGRIPTPFYPGLSCNDALANWGRISNELLPMMTDPK